MNKLINSEFIRILKSKVFRMSALFTVGFALLLIIMRWNEYLKYKEYYEYPADAWQDVVFSAGFYLIFVAAIIVGIFIGTEYSDGTIRNKIMIGHTRINIFLSKFIVCAFADLFLITLYFTVVLICGTLLIGPVTVSLKEIIFSIIIDCFAILALTAIYLTCAMVIDRKAASSVTCLVTAILFSIFAPIIQEKLGEPEYRSEYILTENREIQETPMEKNPYYISGVKRELYKFMLDFMPSGQMLQVAGGHTNKALFFSVYDSVIIIVAAGIGIFIFDRKNLM